MTGPRIELVISEWTGRDVWVAACCHWAEDCDSDLHARLALAAHLLAEHGIDVDAASIPVATEPEPSGLTPTPLFEETE